jgi:hypothetical protein
MSRFDPFERLLNMGIVGNIAWLIIWLIVLFTASRLITSVLRWYNIRYDKTALA